MLYSTFSFYFSFSHSISHPIHFLLHILSIKHFTKYFNYTKNIQGDIIEILDEEQNKLVTYEYNSWGKVIFIKDNNGNEIVDETHIGIINPYRYRGYYYDKETKLYYLNSRYYNPECGRFINADGIINLIGQNVLYHNIYGYCNNNSINDTDPDGNLSLGTVINKVFKQVVSIVSSQTKKYTTTTSKTCFIKTPIQSSLDSAMFSKNNRKPGKTPPKSWPSLPQNLGGKKPQWNPKGYWNGKFGETTWDNRTHGSGIDRGIGAQGGHWDTPNGRYLQGGLALIGGGVALYGGYQIIKWGAATLLGPITGGWSWVFAAATP